jgi:hypothetical protein
MTGQHSSDRFQVSGQVRIDFSPSSLQDVIWKKQGMYQEDNKDI